MQEVVLCADCTCQVTFQGDHGKEDVDFTAVLLSDLHCCIGVDLLGGLFLDYWLRCFCLNSFYTKGHTGLVLSLFFGEGGGCLFSLFIVIFRLEREEKLLNVDFDCNLDKGKSESGCRVHEESENGGRWSFGPF